MKQLLVALGTAAIVLCLCGWAVAVSLVGTVWLSESNSEEAPCCMVSVYPNSNCNYYELLGTDITDSCGHYEVSGLTSGTTVYVTVEFYKIGCTEGSWSGTCPPTTIECEGVYLDPQLPVVNKDWDLGLDECDNIGCD